MGKGPEWLKDAGYDVADFCKVAPRYGTNADLHRLTRAAHKRGIRVCLDLVPGHTSIEHPWFKASCRPERNEYSDRYIWTNSGWELAPQPLNTILGYADRNDRFSGETKVVIGCLQREVNRC